MKKQTRFQALPRAAGVAAALALTLVASPAWPEASASPLATRAKSKDLAWGPCSAFFSEDCRIAVLHGNPAESNSDVFFEVSGGDELPLHWHSSAERMVLVQGELQVRYQGLDRVDLVARQYAYGPVRLPHYGQCVSG